MPASSASVEPRLGLTSVSSKRGQAQGGGVTHRGLVSGVGAPETCRASIVGQQSGQHFVEIREIAELAEEGFLFLPKEEVHNRGKEEKALHKSFAPRELTFIRTASPPKR